MYRSAVSSAVVDRPATRTGPVDAVELEDLWQRYRASGDAGVRERLVIAYAHLARRVARQMRARMPSHVEEADLISSGLVGLISAIERFRPRRRIRFEPYAVRRIRGAILDDLRGLDWAPRAMRARAREIDRASIGLRCTLERAPTDAELAAELEIETDELQASLVQISGARIAALDEAGPASASGDGQVSLLDTLADPRAPDPARVMDATEAKDSLADLVAGLPAGEKLVIGLYYYEDLTLREIADVLGVGPTRTAQLHTAAVRRLRGWLGADGQT